MLRGDWASSFPQGSSANDVPNRHKKGASSNVARILVCYPIMGNGCIPEPGGGRPGKRDFVRETWTGVPKYQTDPRGQAGYFDHRNGSGRRLPGTRRGLGRWILDPRSGWPVDQDGENLYVSPPDPTLSPGAGMKYPGETARTGLPQGGPRQIEGPVPGTVDSVRGMRGRGGLGQGKQAPPRPNRDDQDRIAGHQ